MTDGYRNFDESAAGWDDKPQRVKVASDVVSAMLDLVEVNRGMDILDFGCGTGLVSFGLLPHARSVTGADNSRGMLEVFRSKAAAGALNAKGVYVDLDRGDHIGGEYDLVVSSMTLHHIGGIEPLLRQFFGVLVPGGTVCIADLDPDGGRFHDDNTGIHHFGFERDKLADLLLRCGFKDVEYRDAALVEKQGSDGVMRTFSVFVIKGRKPPLVRKEGSKDE